MSIVRVHDSPLAAANESIGLGRVIQIGSSASVKPGRIQPDYIASTAARHNLTVSLARELKSSGITSNAVAPLRYFWHNNTTGDRMG